MLLQLPVPPGGILDAMAWRSLKLALYLLPRLLLLALVIGLFAFPNTTTALFMGSSRTSVKQMGADMQQTLGRVESALRAAGHPHPAAPKR